MACFDYMLCCKCGNKAYYDADIDYCNFKGETKALCEACALKYELSVIDRTTPREDE